MLSTIFTVKTSVGRLIVLSLDEKLPLQYLVYTRKYMTQNHSCRVQLMTQLLPPIFSHREL
jgi:hypothetical protein